MRGRPGCGSHRSGDSLWTLLLGSLVDCKISSYLSVPVPMRGHESLLHMNRKRNLGGDPFLHAERKPEAVPWAFPAKSLGTGHQSQEKAAHILGKQSLRF